VTSAATWLCVALGLGVLVVRRRSVATALVTAQALLLAALAIGGGGAGADRAASAAALILRGLLLGGLLIVVVRRSREPAPVRAATAPIVRAAWAVALALTFAALVPRLGLTSRDAERAVLALVAFGLVAVATRRATLLQVAGLVVVENGLALAALSVPGGGAIVLELGAAFDLMLVGFVALAFHQRIVAVFGSGDAAQLGSLRD